MLAALSPGLSLKNWPRGLRSLPIANPAGSVVGCQGPRNHQGALCENVLSPRACPKNPPNINSAVHSIPHRLSGSMNTTDFQGKSNGTTPGLLGDHTRDRKMGFRGLLFARVTRGVVGCQDELVAAVTRDAEIGERGATTLRSPAMLRSVRA